MQPVPGLVINLFGAFDARLGDMPVLGWRSEKTKWLLAFLTLHRGEATYALLQETLGMTGAADAKNEFANLRQSVDTFVNCWGASACSSRRGVRSC